MGNAKSNDGHIGQYVSLSFFSEHNFLTVSIEARVVLMRMFLTAAAWRVRDRILAVVLNSPNFSVFQELGNRSLIPATEIRWKLSKR